MLNQVDRGLRCLTLEALRRLKSRGERPTSFFSSALVDDALTALKQGCRKEAVDWTISRLAPERGHPIWVRDHRSSSADFLAEHSPAFVILDRSRSQPNYHGVVLDYTGDVLREIPEVVIESEVDVSLLLAEALPVHDQVRG